MIDFILYCLLGFMTVGMAILGGHVSSANFKHRMAFYFLGIISLILIIMTGYRAYLAQQSAKIASIRLDKTIESLQKSSESIANMSKETLRVGKLNSELEGQLIDQSKSIINLSKTTINTITGGNTYGYFLSMIQKGDKSSYWGFVKTGDFPLYDVEASITDLTKRSEQRDKHGFEFFLKGDITVSLGDLAAGKSAGKLVSMPIPIEEALEHSYVIYFNAKNGFWHEILRRKTVNGKRVEAIQVSTGDKIIFEKIDNNFPRDKKGNIE